MDNEVSIFVSAGDPSADFPGKNLIDEIKQACPRASLFGLGGPLMQEAGLEALADYRQLAVMGFWEVIPRLFFFRNLLKQTVQLIKERRPKAVVLLDYPGFNLRLAKRVKSLGIPIIYYISPQVWAWGGGRIKDIKRLVDLMLVIFPFEEGFYRKHGIKATFVGHPLVDRYQSIPDRAVCRSELGVDASDKLVALLPGSRVQEVKRMLPIMAAVSDIMQPQVSHIRFVLAAVDSIDGGWYRRLIGKRDISIISGRTPEVLNGADFVITSSGTATIETAYFETPMAVVYKTGFLTYQMAKRLVRLDSIGMVNIVAGRKIVPEFIQNDAQPKPIANYAMAVLRDDIRYRSIVADLHAVREKLGMIGAGHRAFEAIREVTGLC